MANVTFVTGDGIGPEIAEATKRCVDATGAEINWDIVEAGVDVMEREGTPLPEKTLESVKRTGVAHAERMGGNKPLLPKARETALAT